MINENITPNNNFELNKNSNEALEIFPTFQNQNSKNILVNKISGAIIKDKWNKTIGTYNIFTLENTLKKIALINIKSDLGDNNSKEFFKIIKKSIDVQHKLIFINFEELSYINCNGINMFLSITKINGFKKDRLIFINLSSNTKELFNLIGFQKIFNFQHTMPFDLENLTESYFSIFNQKKIEPNSNPLKCFSCNQEKTGLNANYFYCSQCESLLKQNSLNH